MLSGIKTKLADLATKIAGGTNSTDMQTLVTELTTISGAIDNIVQSVTPASITVTDPSGNVVGQSTTPTTP